MRHVPGPVYLEVEGERGPAPGACGCKPFDALRPVDGLTDAQRDLAALAYVCDYTILEPVLRVLGRAWADDGLVTASLDHAMWFHRPGPPGWMDGWLLYTQEAVAAEAGRGLGTGRFYTPRRPPPGDRRPGGHDPRAPRRSPMNLSPSAYPDTFARDHLPPADQWPTLEFTTPELDYPQRLNAAVELIDVPVARFGGDRVALRTPDGDAWTYAELQRRANQVAQVLVEDLGLVPGNRVLLRSPNNPWAVACWLGVLKAGGIVATMFAALRARELTPIVEKARPTIALVDHRVADDVHALRETVAPDLTVVAFGSDAADDLVARADQKTGVFAAVETAADDVALFCPTSGSTGLPKITTHFHRDLLSIDNTFGRHVLRLRADDLVACTAPLAFTFGLGMLVVFPLRVGACGAARRGGDPAAGGRARGGARGDRAGDRADGVQADPRVGLGPVAGRAARRSQRG